MSNIIAEIEKNTREKLRVAVFRDGSKVRVDLRIYNLNGEGSFVSSPRGVSIKREILPAVIEALQDAANAIDRGVDHD